MDNDFCLVRRCLIPADAFILCGCLRAAGLNATVMDDQHMQAALLLAPAIGGARVMVPAAELPQALEVLDAFERGELALDDDADVGGARVYEFTPRK
ncbi:hypothetical protein [Pseudoduganella violaceinigra]|uniref:hypothetical protein n=1 Tax=Pseudoduganella violaceinigra TaxID=246602 RepID=UPI000688BF62|nr:hypothetical protein [Pseudoduganella violaceinigra]